MAHHDDLRPQHVGVAGAAMLAVLLLVALLVLAGWRSGLLTVRPSDLTMRLPSSLPSLPHRGPDPAPIPLPKPGPGLEQR